MQTQAAKKRRRTGEEMCVSLQAIECMGGTARGELGMKESKIRTGNMDYRL